MIFYLFCWLYAVHSATGTNLILCVGDSQDHPHILRFPRGTHETQHVVVLMGKIFFSDVHSWVTREEGTAESGGTQVLIPSRSLLPVRGHTELTLFLVMEQDTHVMFL